MGEVEREESKNICHFVIRKGNAFCRSYLLLELLLAVFTNMVHMHLINIVGFNTTLLVDTKESFINHNV